MSWPLVQLGDVANVSAGNSAPQGQDDFSEEGTPFVRAGSLSDLLKGATSHLERIAKGDAKRLKLRLFPKDSILFAKSGMSCMKGYVYRLPFEAHVVSHLAVVQPGPDLSPAYAEHALRVFSPVSLVKDEAYPSIRLPEISGLKIPLPPLEEQRRIAGILDQADALRRLRSRALDKLNTLGQAIFHEMFGEALRGNFFEFGQAVEEFRYGTSNKSGDAGLPTLRIPNVIGGGIDVTEIKTVEVTSAELERLRLRNGDILFVRTNGNPDYVGRCAAFSFADVAEYDAETDWIFASYLIRARLSDRINPVFAKTYFASQIGRAAVRERCKTSAGQYNINTEGLASLPFPVVPRADQDRFAEALSAIEQNTAPMKRSAAKMDEKFASLQYRAFKGEL